MTRWPAIFILCLSASVFAQSKPVLVWLKNDAPPFYFLDGPNKGTAYGDVLQSLLEERLVGYTHKTERIPLSRLQHYWQKGPVKCFATMIHRPPIYSGYLTSRATVLYRPQGIVTTRAFLESRNISPDKPVSLAEFLDQQPLSMGYIAGRSFGATLDRIIAQHDDVLETITRPGGTETKGALTMLAFGRFDFMIEYEFILDYLRHRDFPNTQFVFLPITEMAGAYIDGAVGCSDSKPGRQVLAAIDAALEEVLTLPVYRQTIERWLVKPEQHETYWRDYDAHILNPAEP